MRKLLMSSVAIVVAVTVSGCVTTGNGAPSTSSASQDSCQYDSTLYVAGGAVLGFAVAKLLGVDGKGALLASAAVGGALGKGAQAYLTQRCEQIAEAKKRMESSTVATRPVTVASMPSQNAASSDQSDEAGIALTVSNDSMFQTGGALLSKSAEHDMRELAKPFKGTDRKVLIVGHTDASGSAEANQVLSEQRAQAVAKIFEEEGVPRSSLYFKGAGDTRFIMWLSVLLAWSIMVVPSFVSLNYFDAGLYLLWTFICIYIIIAGLVFYLRFRTGRWKTMRVIEEEAIGERRSIPQPQPETSHLGGNLPETPIS